MTAPTQHIRGPVEIATQLVMPSDPSMLWFYGIQGDWEDADRFQSHMRRQTDGKMLIAAVPVQYLWDIYGMTIEEAKEWRDQLHHYLQSQIQAAEDRLARSQPSPPPTSSPPANSPSASA